MTYTEKRQEEYCKKFGLCKEKGTCQCKKELKFITDSITQAIAEERERMVGLIEEIRGMREESNEALDYLQDRIEKGLLSSLRGPNTPTV